MDKIRLVYNRNAKFYNQILICVLIFVLMYVFISYILEIILPFAFAYLIYLILRPLVNFLDNKTKIKRGIISILSIVLFLFIIGGILYTLTKSAYEQLELFINSKHYTEDIMKLFDDTMFNIKHFFYIFSEEYGEAIINAILQSVYGLADAILEFIKTWSIAIIKGLPQFIMVIIISVVSSFFFLNDEKQISKAYNNNFPKGFIDKVNHIKNNTVMVAFGYIKAQMILSSITFVICCIGLTILNNKYAVILSFVTAFFDMLPFFGSGFILWPSAFISFLNGDITRALITLSLYSIIFLMRQFLEPRTLGKQISLHPLFTLLGLYIGVKFFGFVGLIIGPLTVVLAKSLVTDKNENEE